MNEYAPHFIQAVRAIRDIHHEGLRDTLIFMAVTFGFDDDVSNPEKDGTLVGWRKLRHWCDENKVGFQSVRGPHAITILKAIAAKHGRLNVSTQR